MRSLQIDPCREKGKQGEEKGNTSGGDVSDPLEASLKGETALPERWKDSVDNLRKIYPAHGEGNFSASERTLASASREMGTPFPCGASFHSKGKQREGNKEKNFSWQKRRHWF